MSLLPLNVFILMLRWGPFSIQRILMQSTVSVRSSQLGVCFLTRVNSAGTTWLFVV